MTARGQKIIAQLNDWTARPGGLVVVLLLSLIAKVVELSFLDVINSDSARYIAAAHHFVSGDFRSGIAMYPLPAYPLLLALMKFLVTDWKIAGLATTLVPSLLTTIPVYLTTKMLFDKRAAFWSATAYALSPYLNRYGLYIMRDPMFWFLFSWALYFGIRFFQDQRLRFLVLSLASTWLSSGFRVEGIFFVPVYLCFLFYLTLSEQNQRLPYLKGFLIWIGFPCLFLVVLRFAFADQWLYITQGDYLSQMVRETFSKKFFSHYWKINEDIKNLQMAKGYSLRGHSVLTVTRHYMPLIYLIGILECFFRMLFPLYGLPLVAGLASKIDRKRALLLATGLTFITVSYLFLIKEDWISKRYLSLPVLCLLPWVGQGMINIIQGARNSSFRNWCTLGLAILFFVLPLWGCFRINLKKIDPTLQQAGQWIASQSALSSFPIAASDNRILLYAGRYDAIPRWGQAVPPIVAKLVKSRKKKVVVIDPTGGFELKPGQESFGYKVLKIFPGNHYSVTIYAPPAVEQLLLGSKN